MKLIAVHFNIPDHVKTWYISVAEKNGLTPSIIMRNVLINHWQHNAIDSTNREGQFDEQEKE